MLRDAEHDPFMIWFPYDVLQEVEEDKKRAEQEVMSPHGRKGKLDDLSITINKSCNVSCFIPSQVKLIIVNILLKNDGQLKMACEVL